MNNGTVQATPLTQGEAWEFAAALMQQAPRDLDPQKVRHYLRNKGQLGSELRELLGKPLPAFDTAAWEAFYRKHFALMVDFSNLHIPLKPDYSCRAVVVPVGLTNNAVFDACTKAFAGKTWRYERNLDTVRDIIMRPAGPYVVWVRDTVEADGDMANTSAQDIETAGTNTATLKERMLLELKHHDETGGHLDLENWTLCTGSRYAGGSVPRCYWSGGGFRVDWAGAVDRCSGLRARVVVS